MLTHMQILFLNLPHAQNEGHIGVEYIDCTETNLDTNECSFSVNEEQKVYYFNL